MKFGENKNWDREHILNSKSVVYKMTDKVKDFKEQGFSMTDSAFYNLGENDYHDYISTWESYSPVYRNLQPSGIVSYDNLIYNNIFDDKYLFYIVFSSFVKTPKIYSLIYDGKITDVVDSFDSEHLYETLLSINGGVIKYRAGANGFGIYVFDVKNDCLMYNNQEITRDELANIVSKFKFGIIQEKIVQGKFAKSLFEKTINTIRIISIRKKDGVEHEIVAAIQRIGTNRSAPVDNFAQGGGCSIIDLETGVLGTVGRITETGPVFSDNHPDTGKVIKGLKVPNWDGIKSSIIDLTRKLPFFCYAAWDVVVCDDGITIIEINKRSSLDVFQIHKGLRHELLGQKYKENGWLEDF